MKKWSRHQPETEQIPWSSLSPLRSTTHLRTQCWSPSSMRSPNKYKPYSWSYKTLKVGLSVLILKVARNRWTLWSWGLILRCILITCSLRYRKSIFIIIMTRKICTPIKLGKLSRKNGIVVRVARIMALVGEKTGIKLLELTTPGRVGTVSSLRIPNCSARWRN